MNNLLAQNATVAVVSPSISLSGMEHINIDPAVAYLRSLGLKVKIFPHALTGTHLTAQSDCQKVADLHAAFADPEIKAIFAPHGGASAQRLLGLLDYDLIAKNPKPVIGFSDITALQLAIFAKTGTPFISGFLLGYDFKLGHIDSLVDQTLRQALSGQPISAHGGQTLCKGSAEGVLLGGCLSMLSDLSGTPYYPDLRGALLLIEDECEKPYKIDLMLTQLRQQPHFDEVRGIIFGAFSECEAAINTHGSIDEVLADFASHVNIPVLKDFAYGHIASRHVLPMGVRYRLDAGAHQLEQIA